MDFLFISDEQCLEGFHRRCISPHLPIAGSEAMKAVQEKHCYPRASFSFF